MRHILALVAVITLIGSMSGCRHVAGACDCDHAINPSYGRAPSGGGNCSTCGAAKPQPVAYEQAAR